MDDIRTAYSTLTALILWNIPYRQGLFSHIIHPPLCTTMPYHTTTHITYRDFLIYCIQPKNRTIMLYQQTISHRVTPHTVPYHIPYNVPFHTQYCTYTTRGAQSYQDTRRAFPKSRILLFNQGAQPYEHNSAAANATGEARAL